MSILVYSIAKSNEPQNNFKELTKNNGFIYWDNAKFKKTNPGDNVFITNVSKGNWYLTELIDNDVPITRDYNQNCITFNDDGNLFTVPDAQRWGNFVKLKILESKENKISPYKNTGAGCSTFMENDGANGEIRIKQLLDVFDKDTSPQAELLLNNLLKNKPIKKMYKYYLKKVSNQDVTRTTVINNDAEDEFFGVSLPDRNDEAKITVRYISDSLSDNNIVLLKKQDIRIFLDRSRYKEDDILLFTSRDNKNFDLEIINTVDNKYETYLAALKHNHLLTNVLPTSNSIQSDLFNQNNKLSNMNYPLNQILFGPPGTGKTYSTITKALNIIGLLKEKDTYTKDEYKAAQVSFQNDLGKRIEFVTMHQSFSYEDFVQGIKPVINEFNGNVFIVTSIEDDSANDAKNNYQENINLEYIYDSKVRNYKLINSGDLILVKNREKIFGYGVIDRIESNDTLKKYVKCPNCGKADLRKRTTKELKYLCVSCRHKFNDPKIIEEPCTQFRAVWKERLSFLDFDKKVAEPFIINFNNQVSMQQCENRILDDLNISPLKKTKEIYFNHVDGVFKRICNRAKNNSTDNYVIILDEINRANISRVFGELIALIEKDKRDGKLTSTLPSGESFTVPSNLYIIGTMNTADKSIALVDIALRRRFEFKALYPDTKILTSVLEDNKFKANDIEERVNMLTQLNRIIRSKKSVDFEIGHSYFMDDDNLINILNKQVLPLLNEYFMYDLRKVKEIIEETQKDREGTAIPKPGIVFSKKTWEDKGLLEVESIKPNPDEAEQVEAEETSDEP